MSELKPFDVKYRQQIESGEYKVVTRSGDEVKILSWNVGAIFKHTFDGEAEYQCRDTMILFCTTNSSNEDLIHITSKDGHIGGPGWDSPYDLFIKMSEKEEEK